MTKEPNADYESSEITPLGPWVVGTSQVGDAVNVYPLKGLITVENWSSRYRREYPHTERQIRKAIAACQRYCDKRNAETARGRTLWAAHINGDERG